MIKCPNCQKELGDATEQCYFCGAYIHEDSQRKIEKEKKLKTKPQAQMRQVRNWGQIIGGFFLGLVITVLLVWIIVMFVKKRDFVLGLIIGAVTSAIASLILTIIYTIIPAIS